jgi:hypothetical protein
MEIFGVKNAENSTWNKRDEHLIRNFLKNHIKDLE